jgi:hypothetical protein
MIANATAAYSADDVVITALDAICWISSAWKLVTETTIRNTFRKADFDVLSNSSLSKQTSKSSVEHVTQENDPLEQLGKVLKRLTIDGLVMTANNFVVRLH